MKEKCKKIIYGIVLFFVFSLAGTIGRSCSREVISSSPVKSTTQQENVLATSHVSSNQKENRKNSPEVNGFLDLHFGDSIEEVTRHRQIEYKLDHTWPSGVTGSYYWAYFRDNETPNIGGVEIDAPLNLAFIDNKLSFIYAYFRYNEGDFQKIQSELKRMYGEPFSVSSNDMNSGYDESYKKAIGASISFGDMLAWYSGNGMVSLGTIEMEGNQIIAVGFLSKKEAIQTFSRAK